MENETDLEMCIKLVKMLVPNKKLCYLDIERD